MRLHGIGPLLAGACLGVLATACDVGTATDASDDHVPSQSPSPEGSCAGGEPTPSCGAGACSCCVRCDQREGLCLDPSFWFSLGVGQCRAAPAEGTLQVTVDATPWVAAELAAAVDGAGLEVSARTAAATVAFIAPSEVGDYECAGPRVVSFMYFDATDEYRNRQNNVDLPCTIRITKVGAVGERVEGSFAATLQGVKTGTTLQLGAGTFSVQRVAFP